MKTTITALALAAAVATSGATAVSAMEMEFNMLTGAVFNALKAEGIDPTNIDKLTLAEIAQIKAWLDEDMTSNTRQRVEQLLNK